MKGKACVTYCFWSIQGAGWFIRDLIEQLIDINSWDTLLEVPIICTPTQSAIQIETPFRLFRGQHAFSEVQLSIFKFGMLKANNGMKPKLDSKKWT